MKLYRFIKSFFKKHVFNSTSSTIITIGLVGSFALSYLSFFILFKAFYENIFLCVLAVITALLMSSMALFPYMDKRIGNTKLLVSLLIQASSLIVLFAGIYRGYGLLGSSVPEKGFIEGSTSLYFSIVTWTTLGYGDYQPKTGIQLIATFQSALGYIFLGLAVAIIANMMIKVKK